MDHTTTRVCKDCGIEFERWSGAKTPGAGSSLCRCRPCYNAYARTRPSYLAKRGRARQQRPPVEKTCPDCAVIHHRRNSSVCEPCAADRAIAAERERSRRKNHRRRAAGKVRHVIHSRYTLSSIAERDGFRCHICRRLVKMSLSGMDPQGPTLDHLVPLSQGGPNDPSNLALAHRKCNLKRGTSGEVQLRLVG